MKISDKKVSAPHQTEKNQEKKRTLEAKKRQGEAESGGWGGGELTQVQGEGTRAALSSFISRSPQAESHL